MNLDSRESSYVRTHALTGSRWQNECMPDMDTEDFVPTKWQHAPSRRKQNGRPTIDEKLEAQLALLRGEITQLLKTEKDCQFDLGRLFKNLRDEHARGRSGIYIKLLAKVKTSWKKADRLIKFYERELRVMVAKRKHKTKWAAQLAAWGIEDVDALDRKFNSQAQDDIIATRKIKNEREDERIKEAKDRQKQRSKETAEKRKQVKAEETAPNLVGRIEIQWALSDEEFEIFKEAWMELGDEQGSIIIFKAVTDAAVVKKEN
jgi:DNA polymerase III alpha subunit (gram-positive type)